MHEQQQRTRQHPPQAQQQQQQQLRHSTSHLVKTPQTWLPAIIHRQQGWIWEQQRNSHSSSNMQQRLLPSETCLTAASGHQ
jgi:hypothetical protein